MKALLLALLLVGCHHHSHDATLLQSHANEPTWASVSLTVAGSEVDDRKRDSCVEEAQNAGIQLVLNAPVAGTLYFQDHDDYLEIPGTPNYVFTAMGSNATCKITLAKLTKLDTLVPMSKTEPTDCQALGAVEGSDSGFFHPGSYDAAMAEAQFAVRAKGGNVFVQDAVRQEASHIVINGRGFHCGH